MRPLAWGRGGRHVAAAALHPVVGILGALGAAPATAIGDLTGTYEGSMTCELTNDSESSRSKLAVGLFVDDNGGGNVFIYVNNTLQVFRTAVAAPGGADQGQLGGPACAISPATGGMTIRAAVKAKPGSTSASMKGEMVIFSVGASAHSVSVCRFSAQRVSTDDPNLTACPP
jgi:hypothetical protein